MSIMSRYPAERKSRTRDHILAAAERLIKKRGPQGASVEAVMREAGLTVGGFYAHFPSKEAMVDEALLIGVERSLGSLLQGLDEAPPASFARQLIDRYLEQATVTELGRACPLTLLLPDVARADEAVKQAFAERTAQLVARVETRLPIVAGMAPRDVALALFASLAGAVSFARAAATSRGRDRILAATHASLVRWLGLDDPRVA
jgi:TetR/AcrR family transcriptional repressor of nem operon